eukprot:TRINITY_DN14999_c0_g1_i1.p1 TRINITY_DN14999_c0_g1~~TRINITY_DN14999_c0_g1_i1.p1  ORF type:complete len:174 (-),score=22.34 TRINITY_DN14999_c0_g1_i1:248-769(-)
MTGQPGLAWHRKLLKDALGIYHVSVEVYGVEYAFGNSRAPNSRSLGSTGNGICVHEPRKAGSHNVFKEAVPLGRTKLKPSQIEELATVIGQGDFLKDSYRRIDHNCVDFARRFSQVLEVNEPPSWCHRGASTAKALGLGAEGGGPPNLFGSCRKCEFARDSDEVVEQPLHRLG